jgi:hypothetical protein
MDEKRNTDEDTDGKPIGDDRSAESDTAGSSEVKAPFAPHDDDDSAVGDTDQHSTA